LATLVSTAATQQQITDLQTQIDNLKGGWYQNLIQLNEVKKVNDYWYLVKYTRSGIT
jgi:hypothetical protein